jgi:hypothetical protein
MPKKWLPGLLALGGAGLAGFALLANLFGLDPENDWEAGRVTVAAAGIGLLLLAAAIASRGFWAAAWMRVQNALRLLAARLLSLPVVQRMAQAARARQAAWARSRTGLWYAARVRAPLERAARRLRASRWVRYFADSQDRMAGLAGGLTALAVVVVYVWLISVGFWTRWPASTAYYDRLAEAFLHGQTSLLEQPDPALLALDDPYVYENRQHVPYPWDTVLYNGKFYYYFGAAPALPLMVVKSLYPGTVGEPYVVFAFVTGTFLAGSLLILRLRRRLFPGLSWHYVVPGIAIAGLANPLPWLLNRPGVYEAAISAGQFFLLAGLYTAFAAVDERRPVLWRAALASALWLLAIASRMTLAPAAAFLLAMTAWRAFRQLGRGRDRLLALAALALPFAVGLACLGWYNFDRFGSLLETGYRYQLTGKFVNSPDVHVFSPANLLLNAYTYLLNPFRTLSVFPYVKPNWGGHFLFFPIRGSELSTSEQVTGLLLAVPYFLLAAVTGARLLRRSWEAMRNDRRKQIHRTGREHDGLAGWLPLAAGGACVLAFGPILLYMTQSMRYLGDGVPLLALTSTLGFWLAAQSLEGKRRPLGRLAILVAALAITSIVISLLLAVTGYQARFEHLNPVLFDQLTRLLPP